MATINQFEELKSWQVSRELCQMVFTNFIKNHVVKDYEFVNQINKSSGSTMDNIAEGFERDGNREFNQFLSIAKASCGEVRSQLYRTFDREFISKSVFNDMNNKAEEVRKLIGGLMGYLSKTDIRGKKFVQK